MGRSGSEGTKAQTSELMLELMALLSELTGRAVTHIPVEFYKTHDDMPRNIVWGDRDYDPKRVYIAIWLQEPTPYFAERPEEFPEYKPTWQASFLTGGLLWVEDEHGNRHPLGSINDFGKDAVSALELILGHAVKGVKEQLERQKVAA